MIPCTFQQASLFQSGIIQVQFDCLQFNIVIILIWIRFTFRIKFKVVLNITILVTIKQYISLWHGVVKGELKSLTTSLFLPSYQNIYVGSAAQESYYCHAASKTRLGFNSSPLFNSK